MAQPIRVGVVGSGSWAGHYLGGCQRHPQAEAAAVCNPNTVSAQRIADRFGVGLVLGDVHEMVEREDIDAVAIVTPNDSHAEIAIAALKAGKHVLCEKPMAMNVAQAEQMEAAAKESGKVTGINFTWRNPGAAQYARYLVQQGEIGRIFHINGCFAQGWLTNPRVPLIWRLQKDRTGTGTLGDIGSHIIDLAEWVSGERITELCADLATFVDERPLQDGSGTGRVEVDDAASLLTRFEGGAMGSLVSTRYGTAQSMDQRLEIYGEKGALVMDFASQGSLKGALGRFVMENQMLDLPVPDRFKVTPTGYLQGHVTRFIDAILQEEPMSPSFSDGLHSQRVLEAVEASAQKRAWTSVN